MTHRRTLTETQREAHAILDRAAEGQPIPDERIRWALRVLGDMEPFRA